MLYASKTCDTTVWKSYPSKKVQDLVIENTKRSEIQPSCKKKSAALKSLGEKCCEIKGGDQEMAAIMLMLKNFNNGCVHC